MVWTRLCGLAAILSASIGYSLTAWDGYMHLSWWLERGLTPPWWMQWTEGMREVWWCFFAALAANCLGHIAQRRGFIGQERSNWGELLNLWSRESKTPDPPGYLKSEEVWKESEDKRREP